MYVYVSPGGVFGDDTNQIKKCHLSHLESKNDVGRGLHMITYIA